MPCCKLTTCKRHLLLPLSKESARTRGVLLIFNNILHLLHTGAAAGSQKKDKWSQSFKVLWHLRPSSSATGAGGEQSVAFSSWCLHCPPSLLPLSSPGCSCICEPGEDHKELLCEGMQLLKSDEIQLKRREQVGQQRHPTVPRISGCRAVPPSSDPSPPTPPTRTPAHTLGAPPHPRRTHKQTCVNTSTATPTNMASFGVVRARQQKIQGSPNAALMAAGFCGVPVGFVRT